MTLIGTAETGVVDEERGEAITGRPGAVAERLEQARNEILDTSPSATQGDLTAINEVVGTPGAGNHRFGESPGNPLVRDGE